MTEDESRPLAFVLMPFASEFDRIYQHLIQPSLDEEGYEVRRADTTFDQQNIMRTIVESIATADLIVAELTVVNPNVYYELGIAHAMGKPVVMVAQGLEGIPFDLRSYKTIIYSTEFDEVDAFKESLREVARQRRGDAISFGNPVTDFTPDSVRRTSASSDVRSPRGEAAEEGAEEEMEEEADQEEFGLFDFVHTIETSMEQIAAISEDLTGTVNDFGAKLAARGAEVEAATKSTAPGSAARMMRILKGMASEMNEFSDQVSVELPDFHNAWVSFEDSFTKLLSEAEIRTREDREQAIALQGQMDELREAMSQALAGAEEASGVFSALKGVSRDLNMAVRRVEKTIERVFEQFSTGESVMIRTMNLLDQKISSS